MLLRILPAVWALALAAPQIQAAQKGGFEQLFDGKTLSGWKLVGGHGPGYVPQDGVIYCPADGGGNLFTEKEYADFVFRFEFKLEAAANNGIGIRAPYDGDAAYMGMEIQILEDTAPMYAHLRPAQYHGSVYDIAAARRGSQKPVGEWNREEITAIGRHIKVVVNGKTIVDTNLNDVTDPQTLLRHPGMRRDRGHIGFLGHGPSACWFRNISIKDLSHPQKDNKPPSGFTALFNGRDLTGWKGLVRNPPARAKMSAAELAAEQAKADEAARAHWKVVDGVITYDGKNDNLCTARDYGDFEMLVDWKIGPQGDSGIYLRGSPQVQIWDNPIGSGGLYNNIKNPKDPIVRADNPIGDWNRLRILMVGERVTVFLNETLVVNNVVMENYWERNLPIYPVGQIELQHHHTPLWFKNIYLREIPRAASGAEPRRQ